VPFEVLGIDYAGPITYRSSKKIIGKAYILLFACSLTRAIYLELLPDQTAENCIRSLKRFVTRRGRPKKIYSDNGKTFKAAANWIRKVMKQEQFQNFLARQNIIWQFNLSRAPWWGGQFERMVGLVKRALYKSIGRANLRWGELEEVILDVEIAVNNRPLGYVEHRRTGRGGQGGSCPPPKDYKVEKSGKYST
jgi:transposase